MEVVTIETNKYCNINVYSGQDYEACHLLLIENNIVQYNITLTQAFNSDNSGITYNKQYNKVKSNRK